jgi:peptide/nickel transport system permease protein
MSPILSVLFRRLALGALTLVIVSAIIFLAVEMLPGDIATEILGQSATEETLAALREKLGLDQPAVLRYLDWVTGALTGDFGMSLANQRPIGALIADRAFNTFFLAGHAALIAVPLSLFLGLVAALYRETLLDKLISTGTLAAISFPEYFVAYILILHFAVQLGWFPSLASVEPGMALADRLHATFLPALTMTLIVTAHMMRMTRAAIVNLLALPYVEMAQLKGMRRWRVIAVHALRECAGPDRQRHRAEPGLSDRRRGAGRGGLRLSRPGAASGGQRGQARLSGGAGGLPDLRRHLYPAEPCGRPDRHPVEPAPPAPEMTRCPG